MFDLRGKTAAVTGASRGIGLAVAELLASAGADVIGSSSAMPGGPSPARAAVEAHGRSFTPVAADLADPEQVADLADLLVEREVDILVNNGGTIRRAPAAEHRDEDFDHVLAVNLRATWVLSRRVGAVMLARGSGRIVTIASMLSFQGGITVPGYTASKHAVVGLTKALANEWAAHGVNVNAVAPGYIATDNTRALREDPARDRAILDRIPAARWGRPDDIAGAVLFLCSRAAEYLHGVVLPVDGGWLAR
ncbi:MAG: SDR family oxidoreductase [Saccharothrix sp.]|nr:SDR family oxidoreductase [Saccharothrix sp.]